MIEMKNDVLHFSFPELERGAEVRVHFQRTLRIPDDEETYPLPAGLGKFPLRHIDDHAKELPEEWIRRGGVMMPMYQSEAMWIRFESRHPFAVKVAAGKINAVTGKTWSEGLDDSPQNYVVVPSQPWLDGYAVEKGVIRQFVAMPLGSGYSVEEQITGEAEWGGVQIQVFPLREEPWREHLKSMEQVRASVMLGGDGVIPMASLSATAKTATRSRVSSMGLGSGGRMRQHIYQDRRPLDDWDTKVRARCFVHLLNSLTWRAATGQNPPTAPFTVHDYKRAGIPWFEYYGEDGNALDPGTAFDNVLSVFQMGKKKGDVPLPENESVEPTPVVGLRAGLGPHEVRDGEF